jgi:hypothetical protein
MSNTDQTPEKPVEDWVTGDEPMTGPQRSYLETLAREAGEHLPEQLTKAEASRLIDRLQQVTGRGEPGETKGRPGGDSGPSRSVDELSEQGIVDQQAAVQFAAEGSAISGGDDERPPGHPAEQSPPVSAGEVLSDRAMNPAGTVGRQEADDSYPRAPDGADR